MDQRDQLRAFEVDLDRELASRKVYSCGANESLGLVANIYETVHAERHEADVIERGRCILAPVLVSGRSGHAPDVEELFEDILFASHYYMLREYLYYSYNVPGSMAWTFTPECVEIKFADPTIPRQFFTVFNDMLLNSTAHFSPFTGGKEIRRLLKGEPENVETPNAIAAFKLIEEEVAIKLRAYFSILPDDSDIDLGGYTYRQFITVYRWLMAKSLYHRYLASTNNAVGAIFFDEVELISAFETQVALAPSITSAILSDLVFDQTAIRDRCDASYFSLYREGSEPKRIVMRPHHFCISEGLVNLLRVVAQRRPETFLRQVSKRLGDLFVDRVKNAFEEQSFICHKNVSLLQIDHALPDIDLVVISEEPTLGYVVFVCEVKSPLPPRWAKDQLKVLNRDSVSKAFEQSRKASECLKTGAGVSFLGSLLPKGGHPHLDEFVIAVCSLVITSDNSGMFFGAEKTPVINFRTLENILRHCDGDIAYVQHLLRTYNEHADQCVKIASTKVRIGDRKVNYEGVGPSPLLDFPKNKWRSSRDRQAMVDEFIADGAHPFDVFEKEVRDEIDKHMKKGQPVRIERSKSR